MNKKLLEEFNVSKVEKSSDYTDYEAFENKDLLEELRINILNEISSKDLPYDEITMEVIQDITNNVIFDYELTDVERNYLYDLINSEINGYGPLTELLKDDNVSEIMVNSANNIYIEIDGAIEKDESVSFINDDHIVRTIEKLISKSGKIIDINNPIVDARLEDGSRINAVIPPLSKNPVITIRKFKTNIEKIDDLIGNGTLTAEMASFLELAVKSKLNILISGAAGSGKTTLLNILSNFIDNEERIITIEDVLELNIQGDQVISLETKAPNYEGKGGVTVHDLVTNSIRMRPDRIIIGEIRGYEAFDYLDIMNTGHEGTITTIHANNANDALNRLETMATIGAKDIPLKAIREYIANTVDLVIHLTKMKNGRRKVVEILSVEEVKENEIITKNIFEFNTIKTDETGNVEGEFIKNVTKNKAINKIELAGHKEIKEIIKKK